MLMDFMLSKAKEVGAHIDMYNEEQVNQMFQKISGNVFALENNKLCETFSWHPFTMAVSKE